MGTEALTFEWDAMDCSNRRDISAAFNCYKKSFLVARVEKRKRRWVGFVYARGMHVLVASDYSATPHGVIFETEEFMRDVRRMLS